MIYKFENKSFDINEISQLDDIPYQKSLSCGCDYADYINTNSYNVIGYASTDYGYMAVFECPKCHQQYRHHINSTGRYDFDEFMDMLLLIYNLKANL